MKKLNKIFNFRPLLIIAISLIFGILSAYFFVLGNIFFAICSVVAFLIVSVLSLLFSDKMSLKSALSFGCIFLAFFLIGNGLFSLNIKNYQDADLDNHYFTVEGKIKEFSEIDEGYKIILTDVTLYGIERGKTDYNIALYSYGELIGDVGDVIKFNSLLIDKDIIYDGKFSAYDIERKIKYIATLNSEDIYLTGNKKSVFDTINLAIRDTLKEGLDQQEFTIAYALLTGNSEYMDFETMNNFRGAGVSHIFAVSGLHIGFLAFFLNLIFKKTKMNKVVKFIIIAFILFFYCGICGFSASSLRAFIMCLISLLLDMIFERYDGLSALSISAIIILLISPVQLFCVGFQLSFSVVFAILTIAPVISRVLRFLPKKISDSLGVVLSAFIISVPILLSAFGEFSFFSVVVNLIFVPIIGIIFILLFILTFVSMLISPSVILFVINYILKGVNFFISLIDYTVFSVGGFSFGALSILYYLTCIVDGETINLKRIYKIVITSALSLIIVIGGIFYNVQEKNKTEAFVCGAENFSFTMLSSKNENVLIVSASEYNFSLSRLKKVMNLKNIDKVNYLIILEGKNTRKDVILTRIYREIDIDNVLYYGERDLTLESVASTFKGVCAYSFLDLQEMNLKHFACQFVLSGYAIKTNILNDTVLVFSRLGNNYSKYFGLSGNFDTIIAYDYYEKIFDEYNPNFKICYRGGSGYKNGESNGILRLVFD